MLFLLKCIAFGLGLALLLPALAGAESGDRFLLRDRDRVVFYGDSITDGEWYPTLVETYVLTRFPSWRNEFSNRGVSGDNSGSIKRFVRDVVDQKPQAVTYMMGFNDGGYAPLRADTLLRFLTNVEHSVQLVRAANPRARILLASPPVNELAVSSGPPWISHPGYPYTLLMFGQEEGKLAARLGVGFVDIASLYGQTIGLGEVVARQAFALSRDGVHPQQEGQTFLAYHFLRAMGAEPLLAEVAIDATKAKLLDAKRCKVSDLANKDGVITFKRACESLPYPTPVVARPFAFLVNLDDALNSDQLVVKGLTAPSYVVSVDDRRIAEVSAAELEDGLNLSRYPMTPMYEQAMAVLDAVRKKDSLEIVYWKQFIVPAKADGAGVPLPSADAAARAEMETARKQLTEATQACYALNTPKPHTIKLQPSTNVVARFASLANAEWNQAHLDIAVAPVKVDWNAMAVTDRETTVTIRNPSATAKRGTIRWSAGAGWTITPAEAPFVVEPGKSQAVKFEVACRAGTPLLPPPSATVCWPWTKDWPYPMRWEGDLADHPVLTIQRATAKVTLDGDLGDWRDATTFALDDVHYLNVAVPGKRLLWNGPKDLSAQVFLKWDADALYLAALVHDDEHIQTANDTMMWSQDLLHTAFWTQESGKPDGRFEFGFGAFADRDHIVRYTNTAKDAAGPDIQFKSRVDRAAGTCAYEIMLPWARLAPFAPQPGKSLRFTFAIGEADSQPGKGFNYLGWTQGINYGKNPNDLATIVLGAQ